MSFTLQSSALDADESLHLAIHASQNGDFHAAISYLKELLSHDPANAAGIYFSRPNMPRLDCTSVPSLACNKPSV